MRARKGKEEAATAGERAKKNAKMKGKEKSVKEKKEREENKEEEEEDIELAEFHVGIEVMDEIRMRSASEDREFIDDDMDLLAFLRQFDFDHFHCKDFHRFLMGRL